MKYFILLTITLLSAFSNPKTAGQNNNEFNKIIHESLLKLKKTQKVPGFAFALFDNRDIIFTDCVGSSTLGFNINEETLFNIQSISKNITALAVIKAVQDGLLDLDTPISEYLPSFSVNSCFEVSPEEKITLRMLLSHTAGFTHEAPVGNNYNYTPCSNEDHLKSIEETWLKFPAGTYYSYSNLGFDIATSIISHKSGIDFNEYLRSEIFLPLGMSSTTTNDNEVLQNNNRTDGTISAVKNKHYRNPLPGSGAVYTSLSDFIKYTQLLMSYGVINNDTLIDRQGLNEMFKINVRNYGLGSYIDVQDDIIYVNHNGGGFGFGATVLWFPEFNLGSVLLCNKPCNTFDICYSLMNGYIKDMKVLQDTAITASFETLNGQYYNKEGDGTKRFVSACKCDTLFKPEWEKYLGRYSLILKGMDLKWYARLAHSLGFGYQNFRIIKEGEQLKTKGFIGESVLKEYQPGLFFTDDFEALNLQSEKKTFRNILILKKK